MNVTGWRAEPEQIISDHTARLLRWMHATPPPVTSMETAAPHIAAAWQNLLSPNAVTVWGRRAQDDDLSLLALRGDGTGGLVAQRDGQDETPRVLAPAGLLPSEPFWLENTQGAALAFVLRLASLSGFPEESPPSLAIALHSHGSTEKLIGIVLLWLSSPDGLLSEAMQPLIEAAAAQSSNFLASAARAERLARSFRQLGEAVAAAIDAKDFRRGDHSKSVSYYAGLIARALILEDTEVETIEFAALVHDLGRISVPDSILQSTDSLTPQELETVRSAPLQGAKWLQKVDGMAEVATIVRHQGEKYDGTGTPDGLSGEAIPLGSRVIALATRFAAMTTSRADRRPLSVVGGAMDAVVEASGTVLDPRIVEAFLRAMGRTL